MPAVETRLALSTDRSEKPFLGMTEFLPVNRDGILKTDKFAYNYPFLCRGMVYDGIGGYVYVGFNSNLLGKKGETPLGEIKTEIISKDNKVEVRGLPLTISAYFTVRTMDDFELLMDHPPRFDLGAEEYYLKFHIQDEPNYRDTVNNWLTSHGSAPMSGEGLYLPTEFVKRRGQASLVLLPEDLPVLEQGIALGMSPQNPKEITSLVKKFPVPGI